MQLIEVAYESPEGLTSIEPHSLNKQQTISDEHYANEVIMQVMQRQCVAIASAATAAAYAVAARAAASPAYTAYLSDVLGV